jgi:hypothetical protein
MGFLLNSGIFLAIFTLVIMKYRGNYDCYPLAKRYNFHENDALTIVFFMTIGVFGFFDFIAQKLID